MKFLTPSFLALSNIFVGAFSTPCTSIQQRGVFIPKFETRAAEDAPDLTKIFDDLLAEVKSITNALSMSHILKYHDLMFFAHRITDAAISSIPSTVATLQAEKESSIPASPVFSRLLPQSLPLLRRLKASQSVVLTKQ